MHLNFLRTSNPGDGKGLLWREKSQGIQKFWQQRPGSQNTKRLLLIKENQVSQVQEVKAFLCMGRCKSLGSLKYFL